MDIIKFLNTLDPIDLSILMFTLYIIDLWVTLRVVITKHRTFLSKNMLSGFAYNLIYIMAPIALEVLSNLTRHHENVSFIHFASVVLTIVFSTAVVGSILANYASAYPETENTLVSLIYKAMPFEVRAKQEKHSIQTLQKEIAEDDKTEDVRTINTGLPR